MADKQQRLAGPRDHRQVLLAYVEDQRTSYVLQWLTSKDDLGQQTLPGLHGTLAQMGIRTSG
jgi:hypothetical protein